MKQRNMSSSGLGETDNRIPTELVQQYKSVSVDTSHHSEEQEEDEEDGELGHLNHKGRKFRAPPLGSSGEGGNIILRNAKMIVVMMLIVFGAVLIMYKSSIDNSRKRQHRDSAAAARNPDIDKFLRGDDDAVGDSDDDILPKDKANYAVKYDLQWMHSDWNPFNLGMNEEGDMGPDDSVSWHPPQLTWTPSAKGKGDNSDSLATQTNGYIMQVDVVNRMLAFVSEGDLYVTQYTRKTINQPQPATKITTTIGNVRTPSWHPHLPIVAFTATYEGTREVYLQDLRSTQGSIRLTFWDHSHGITRVVGWQDANTLLIAAQHTAVAMPDVRLFQLTLAQGGGSHAVMEITPVPLSQAEDAMTRSFEDGDGKTYYCYYFTRNSQSSHTLRYLGGTVEQLWAYCDGKDYAVPLTSNYNGTSKMPTYWHSEKNDLDYLFFASDRAPRESEDGDWKPGAMNLWAMPLPTPESLYPTKKKDSFTSPTPLMVTNLQCIEQGRTLQEYRIDQGGERNVVLRMGADLFEISSDELESIFDEDGGEHPVPVKIGVQVVSDFHETQERLIPFDLLEHWDDADVVSLPTGQISVLLTTRGQTWMIPVLHDTELGVTYQGGGQNMPPRRYRVAPGALTGGSMRVLASLHVPLYGDDPTALSTRLALILATDPLSATAEHAFYLLPIQESAPSAFADLEHAPLPFLGGHVNGGSTKNGGLGSILPDSVMVSPCGRRLAWADTDGRIGVMTLPLFHEQYNSTVEYTVLPDNNELGEPMDGTNVDLVWSPGGRYLTITHVAKNKFEVISIADLGVPSKGKVELDRVVQATPSRFNSMRPYWGRSRVDPELAKYNALLAKITGEPTPDEDMATTLYFLTDRDLHNDASSPWGHRAPMPHFPRKTLLYALPLLATGAEGSLDSNVPLGRFSGGGAMEALATRVQTLKTKIQKLLKSQISSSSSRRHLEETSTRLAQIMVQRGVSGDSERLDRLLKESTSSSPASNETETAPESPFPVDMDIDFGPKDLTFARRAYRMVHIPESNYYQILSQTEDNGSILLVDATPGLVASIQIFSADAYPYDDFKQVPLATPAKRLASWGLSTDRQFITLAFIPDKNVKVIKNTIGDVSAALTEFAGGSVTKHLADLDAMTLSVWPKLEYKQLFDDAWRMLRDYFWDVDMHQLDWPAIHERYTDLVDRCAKREELDDVLAQMAAEVSALHVFVYGGEYNAPFGGDKEIIALHQPASLGASLKRVVEWKGYMITEIPHRDPDFNLVVGQPVYSPLSAQALWQTGQKGLEVGDVIVGVNGESVFRFPDINMLLRGMAGRTVRLEVLRLKSGDYGATDSATPEPVMVVPLTHQAAENVRYNAWEYKTREAAKSLAEKAGFSVGYAHLRAMGSTDINAFAQGFFEDYNKEALILDVRHNHGGNIDSWVTTMLQRAAWSYFGGRNTRFGGGDMDWDQQGSFQGHVIVLIDEHTSSDGEGVSRSISELGLGRLVGTRTWGGGIWLASDNKLVDGGIATAPEFGVYNEEWGWGMGIEQQGVSPDVWVDNDPRMTFDGKDAQLETAIAELKAWLKREPIIIPKAPLQKPDKSLSMESCASTKW